jgi:hypothetical protein
MNITTPRKKVETDKNVNWISESYTGKHKMGFF